MRNDLDGANSFWRVSPDPMSIIDRHARFTQVNPAWETVLGWAPHEMLGREFWDFVHPDDVPATENEFQRVLAGEPVLRFENRYHTVDGDYRWLSWVAVPDNDSFYCSVRDVTEDKYRQQRIEEQEREAKLREQFLAILGHDLRTPVASVRSGIRLLSGNKQSAQDRDILSNMLASTRRMTELIDNLMDLARLQLGGGIAIEATEVTDLDQRIKHVVAEVQTSADNPLIRSDISIPGAVRCDAPRLMQVLSNLLANAVTHGAQGAQIDVSAIQEDRKLTLSVCNMGEPISDETIQSLSSASFKGRQEAGQSGGLGLGLYICAQIVRAHGGVIDAGYLDGRVCFTVTVPV